MSGGQVAMAEGAGPEPTPSMVLVVEDDAGTAELERRALAGANIGSRRAETVAGALAAIARDRYAAVLLDYALPDGEPWPVVEAASAQQPRVPVILVTGMGSERIAATAHDRGAAAYVIKTRDFLTRLPGVVERAVKLAAAEDRVRSTQSLFQMISDHASDVICMHDPRGVILYASPACRRVFGYEPNEIIGQSHIDFVHPEDRAAVLAASADGARRAYRHRRKDGSYVQVECMSSSARDPSTGAAAETVAIIRDITERRRGEETLRALLEASPDALLMVARSGRIDAANSLAAVLFGYAPGELVGLQIEDLVPVRYREDHVRHREAYRRDPGVRPAGTGRDFRGLRKDGTEIMVDVGLSPVRNGTAGMVLASVRDVTALRAEEQRVRAALAERELLLKEVHHRVKNNLQLVSSLLHLQATHVHGDHPKRLFLESEARVRPIALAHERLYHAADLASIDLHDYLESLVSGVIQTFGAGRVRFAVSAPGVRLGIDTAVPVGMIVNELITNSIKHAFPGERTGTIDVNAGEPGEGELRVEVADDGVGMPDSVDPSHPSSMGLQIVASLTAQLAGKLEVSRQGGTRVSLTFARPAAPAVITAP